MNKTVNKLLLPGHIFMPEMHLKQPGFTYNACGLFTKNKKRIQKFKGTADASYIYKNEFDKVCFQHIWHMKILKISKEEQVRIKF